MRKFKVDVFMENVVSDVRFHMKQILPYLELYTPNMDKTLEKSKVVCYRADSYTTVFQ
jgi:hypothetical protein